MKKFALYLPQFHEIEENNRWWGKGFTEWNNVKNAEPLYKGHVQPKHPLSGNYYDLLERKTVEWQTDLAKQFGLDGFVYYHYYFEGKLLLEKPAENLLEWKDINQQFFFCWANHHWYKGTGTQRTILMEQGYGDPSDWERHFEYLLPFFRDKRYEKKDNKPLFMLFMPCFEEKHPMMTFFNEKCKSVGFDGICIIEAFAERPITGQIKKFEDDCSEYCEYIYFREPNISLNHYRSLHPFKNLQYLLLRHGINFSRKVCTFKGESLYEYMNTFELNRMTHKKVMHGIFFEWDNTPRHKRRGYIIFPPKKETFLKYMDEIKDDDYVIINAWNEWGEGMVMEPSEEYGYRYLKWISDRA